MCTVTRVELAVGVSIESRHMMPVAGPSWLFPLQGKVALNPPPKGVLCRMDEYTDPHRAPDLTEIHPWNPLHRHHHGQTTAESEHPSGQVKILQELPRRWSGMSREPRGLENKPKPDGELEEHYWARNDAPEENDHGVLRSLGLTATPSDAKHGAAATPNEPTGAYFSDDGWRGEAGSATAFVSNIDSVPFEGILVQMKENQPSFHEHLNTDRDSTGMLRDVAGVPREGGHVFGASAPKASMIGTQKLFEDEYTCVWDTWVEPGKWEDGRFMHTHKNDFWLLNLGFKGAVMLTEFVNTVTHEKGETTTAFDVPQCKTFGRGLKKNSHNTGSRPHRGIIVEVKRKESPKQQMLLATKDEGQNYEELRQRRQQELARGLARQRALRSSRR